MRGNFLALGFFKVISQILRLYIIAFFGTLLMWLIYKLRKR